jgi:hypothetical protein
MHSTSNLIALDPSLETKMHNWLYIVFAFYTGRFILEASYGPKFHPGAAFDLAVTATLTGVLLWA